MPSHPKLPKIEKPSVDRPVEIDDTPPPLHSAPGPDGSTETRKGSSEELLCRAMYERFLQSDFPRALTIAETLLEIRPQHPMATVVVERCRAEREVHRSDPSRLAPSTVLVLTLPQAHLKLLPLDPTFVFLLSRLDGTLDLESALDVCGQRLEDVRDRLADLVWRGMLATR